MLKIGDKVKYKKNIRGAGIKKGDIGYIVRDRGGGFLRYGVAKETEFIFGKYSIFDEVYCLAFDENELEKIEDNCENTEYPDVKIEMKDNKVKVIINGKELKGVTKVGFNASVDEAPKLELELIPTKEMIK